MENIKDILDEAVDPASEAKVDKPNPFVVGDIPKVIEANPASAEWNLVTFKHNVTMLVNEYLSSNSAIFIVDFMQAITSDVSRIADMQINDLMKKYDHS